jgi:predicted Na+-dependent transporter
VGRLLGAGTRRPSAIALLLTTSMRDFAIAAGLATAAFGPAASAPLGLYGIVVLVWGTAAAGVLRHRHRGSAREPVTSGGGQGIEGIEQRHGAAGQVGGIAGDQGPAADSG